MCTSNNKSANNRKSLLRGGIPLSKKPSMRKLWWEQVLLWIAMVICCQEIYWNILQGTGVIQKPSSLFGGRAWAISIVLEVIFFAIVLWHMTHRTIEYDNDLYENRYQPPKAQIVRESIGYISAILLIALGVTAIFEAAGFIQILRPTRYAVIRAVCLLGAGIVLNVTAFQRRKQKILSETRKEESCS